MSGRLGELLVILAIVFVFFGAGKLPKVMSEFGRGLRTMRKELKAPETSDEQTPDK